MRLDRAAIGKEQKLKDPNAAHWKPDPLFVEPASLSTALGDRDPGLKVQYLRPFRRNGDTSLLLVGCAHCA